MQTRLNVLFAGNHADGEFQPAYESLTSLARVTAAADTDAAMRWFREGFAADVMVVAQERPGQWSREVVDALRRGAPIAPVIALMGSWCAAATRHGHAWPGVTHVSCHRWESDILPGFQQLLAGECPWWAWPTPADDERRLRLVARGKNGAAGIVAICTVNRDTEAWLADACRAGGYGVLLVRRHELENSPHVVTSRSFARGLTAILWESGDVQNGDAKPWRGVAEAFDDAPVILLVNFQNGAQRIGQGEGAAAILSKPFGVGALHKQLDMLRAQ